MAKQQETPFQRWYRRHGDELNAERRRRYQEDPDYAERARQRAREYRREGPKTGPQEHYRTVNGVHQRVYRVTEAAEHAGVNQSTIRRWESQGFIPAPTIPGSLRLYTWDQVQLIAQAAAKRAERGRSAEDTERTRLYIQQQWEQ